MFPGQASALSMHDEHYCCLVTLGLQKDSEFLMAFNHYLLKEMEHGIIKRLYRNYHIGLFVDEEFGMSEAQPLGINNVMFPFVSLAIGGFVSVVMALMEYVKNRFMSKTLTRWT